MRPHTQKLKAITRLDSIQLINLIGYWGTKSSKLVENTVDLIPLVKAVNQRFWLGAQEASGKSSLNQVALLNDLPDQGYVFLRQIDKAELCWLPGISLMNLEDRPFRLWSSVMTCHLNRVMKASKPLKSPVWKGGGSKLPPETRQDLCNNPPPANLMPETASRKPRPVAWWWLRFTTPIVLEDKLAFADRFCLVVIIFIHPVGYYWPMVDNLFEKCRCESRIFAWAG